MASIIKTCVGPIFPRFTPHGSRSLQKSKARSRRWPSPNFPDEALSCGSARLTWYTRPVCCGRVDHRNAALDHFVAAFLLDKVPRLYEQKTRAARCRASPKRAVRGRGGHRESFAGAESEQEGIDWSADASSETSEVRTQGSRSPRAANIVSSCMWRSPDSARFMTR